MKIYEVRDAIASLHDAMKALDSLGFVAAAAYVSQAIHMVKKEQRKELIRLKSMNSENEFKEIDILIESIFSNY
jgi:hypothetical protein